MVVREENEGAGNLRVERDVRLPRRREGLDVRIAPRGAEQRLGVAGTGTVLCLHLVRVGRARLARPRRGLGRPDEPLVHRADGEGCAFEPVVGARAGARAEGAGGALGVGAAGARSPHRQAARPALAAVLQGQLLLRVPAGARARRVRCAVATGSIQSFRPSVCSRALPRRLVLRALEVLAAGARWLVFALAPCFA